MTRNPVLFSVLVGVAVGALTGSVVAHLWGAAIGGILGAAVGLASAPSGRISGDRVTLTPPSAARARREAGRHAGDRPLSEGEVQSIARSGRQSTAIFDGNRLSHWRKRRGR